MSLRSSALGGSLQTVALVLTLVTGLSVIVGTARASAEAAASDVYVDAASGNEGVLGNLNNVLGAPDGALVTVGLPTTAPQPYGVLHVTFVDNVVFDGNGVDLRLHAADVGSPAIALIGVGLDESSIVIVDFFSDAEGQIDIDLAAVGLSSASAARIAYQAGWLPGFDLDAVEGLNSFDPATIALTLEPPTDTTPGFQEHTVLTTVNDGAPVAGIRVSFAIVDGPNAGLSGVAATFANGVSSFAWTGDGTEGTDTLEAWLDLDADGIRGEGEPFGVATKQWRNGVTGTIAISDLGGPIEVVVADLDLDLSDGADSFDVTVASTSDSAGITLILTETDAHSGIFVGTLGLGAASDPGSMTLAAVAGDTVTATYDDVIDANNDDPAPVTASLVIAGVEDEDDHATVCHLPPGNPDNQRTITIGTSAVAAHIAHGDTEGECAASEVTPKGQDATHGPAVDKPGGGPPEGKGKPPK